MSTIRELEEIISKDKFENSYQEVPVKNKSELRLTLEIQQDRDEGKTIPVRTGLTMEEFHFVHRLLEQEPAPLRRGRELLDMDICLVIFLQWLRIGQSYSELATSFKLHRCRVQSITTDLWNPPINVLHKELLLKKPYDYVSRNKFDNFEDAIGALDATLIRVTKPVSRADANKYLSGKHRAYGIRLRVLVAPDGYCIHYGGIKKGRRHDIVLYQKSKLANDMIRYIKLSDGTTIPTRGAILADGGYCGIHATYPEAVIPRKRLPHQQLSPEDKEFNRKLGHN